MIHARHYHNYSYLEVNWFFHIRYLKRDLFAISFSTLEKKRNNTEILVAEYINITWSSFTANSIFLRKKIKSFKMLSYLVFVKIAILQITPKNSYCPQFSSVQSLSRVWLFATPWTGALQASLSITSSWSLLKPMSIESVMPSNHLILCRPLLLLPPIPPSIRVFSNESALHMRWPKYWSLSSSISPSNEHPGLVSFRMDWLDLLAVQGTLKSLLQHCSSKASILQHSAFFKVQLSHPYMTTEKTIALTRRTFVGKCLCFLIFCVGWL